MDMYEVFGTVSTVCTVLCILCFLLTVLIFFLFRIRDVIGFLSGTTRRKSVRELETTTAASGKLPRKVVGGKTGRTDRMQKSGALGEADIRSGTPPNVGLQGQPIQPGGPEGAGTGGSETMLLGADETGVLNAGGGTAGETALLEAGATSLLSAGETALLTKEDPIIMTPQMQNELGMGLTMSLEKKDVSVVVGTFQIINEIVYVHSDEVI